MNDNAKQFNIIHGEKDKEYEIPEECALAEKASKELSQDNLEGHYRFINILTLAVIMLFTCIFFIAVSGSDIVEDNNASLSFKTFMSGDYTQAIEDTYNNSLPFPEAMKAIEERISLIYGIGNKVTDPIREIDDDTDVNHNSFDEPNGGDENDTDENVITTTQKSDNGEVTTTKKAEEKKKTTTTTAIDRPDESETSSTTTTGSTTTNNDKPYFTVTTTVPIDQPGPTTTTTTTETTTTTTTTTTSEPPEVTSSSSEETGEVE